MKNVKLFKIASIFALALLVGFVFTTVNTKTVSANSDVEASISVDENASLAVLNLDFEKCGDGKTTDDKKKTTKGKTTKKKDYDTKTKDCDTKTKDCDTKTKDCDKKPATKCGGGC